MQNINVSEKVYQHNNTKRFLILAFSVLLLIAMSGVALGTPRWVATTGINAGNCSIDDCLTIQYAISQSADGDIINVGTGTYNENIVISQNNLTLQSIGGYASTFIDGNGVNGTIVNISNVNEVVFDGFTIQNASSVGGNAYGIFLDRVNDSAIKNSVIKNIQSNRYAFGMYLTNSNSNHISNIFINDLHQTQWVNMLGAWGIWVTLSDNNVFSDIEISDIISFSDAQGIMLYNGADGNTFSQTTIFDLTTTTNSVWGYPVGVSVWSATNSCNNNIFTDTFIFNLLDETISSVDGWGAGIQVRGNSVANSGNTFINTYINNVSTAGLTYGVAITTGSSAVFRGGSITNLSANPLVSGSARGFNIWKEASALSSATITDMNISVDGYGVAIRSGIDASLSSIENCSLINSNYSIISTGFGDINAINNYWGSENPNFVELVYASNISSNIAVSPYFIDAELKYLNYNEIEISHLYENETITLSEDFYFPTESDGSLLLGNNVIFDCQSHNLMKTTSFLQPIFLVLGTNITIENCDLYGATEDVILVEGLIEQSGYGAGRGVSIDMDNWYSSAFDEKEVNLLNNNFYDLENGIFGYNDGTLTLNVIGNMFFNVTSHNIAVNDAKLFGIITNNYFEAENNIGINSQSSIPFYLDNAYAENSVVFSNNTGYYKNVCTGGHANVRQLVRFASYLGGTFIVEYNSFVDDIGDCAYQTDGVDIWYYEYFPMFVRTLSFSEITNVYVRYNNFTALGDRLMQGTSCLQIYSGMGGETEIIGNNLIGCGRIAVSGTTVLVENNNFSFFDVSATDLLYPDDVYLALLWYWKMAENDTTIFLNNNFVSNRSLFIEGVSEDGINYETLFSGNSFNITGGLNITSLNNASLRFRDNIFYTPVNDYGENIDWCDEDSAVQTNTFLGGYEGINDIQCLYSAPTGAVTFGGEVGGKLGIAILLFVLGVGLYWTFIGKKF